MPLSNNRHMNHSSSFDSCLTDIFNEVKFNEPLSRHTTLRVGGPASRFVTCHSTEQLTQGINICQKFGIPFFILGWGSNIIVQDKGYAGLVIQNRSQNWQILQNVAPSQTSNKTPSRFEPVGSDYYTKKGLEYSDADASLVIVRVDSGAKLGPLMNALFHKGITGLQWFAGIPATVGGAIYMNMHGGEHFFGALVDSALITKGKEVKRVDHKYFQFGYDTSVLHQTREVILHSDLRLRYGNVADAKNIARKWAARKAIQPQISSGCIFRNLTHEEQSRLTLPSTSIGYLIEHVLKLKAKRFGDAIISPNHAAFIENIGQATATDVIALIDCVKEKAKKELKLDLILEVEIIDQKY